MSTNTEYALEQINVVIDVKANVTFWLVTEEKVKSAIDTIC